jgi:hypothetical protein
MLFEIRPQSSLIIFLQIDINALSRYSILSGLDTPIPLPVFHHPVECCGLTPLALLRPLWLFFKREDDMITLIAKVKVKEGEMSVAKTTPLYFTRNTRIRKH